MKRHDYLPFGEELYAGIGGRSTTQGYTGDSVRQKFTNKERDNETGLDYFAARFYASSQGRFTSADSYGGRLINPQTLNRYSYVRNNPLKYVDPTGHQDIDPRKRGKKGEHDEDDYGNTPDTPQVEVVNHSEPCTCEHPAPQTTAGYIVSTILDTVLHPAMPNRYLRSQIHSFFRDEQVPLAMATMGTANLEFEAEEIEAGMDAAIEGEIDTLVETLVVRGGENLPENFIGGSRVTVDSNGLLNGVSVNSAPGRTLEELSQGIPNKQIGVTTINKITEAGGKVTPKPTANNPYHCEVCGITADKASKLFTPTIKNPHKP